MRRFFTSESVTEGHPDKIADQISDAILDDILKNDPNGRVACETICATGMVMVFGEISTNHYVDVQKIVRDTVTEIGYVRGKYGFDADNLAVLCAINSQSEDIALGVDETKDHEQGAGDQESSYALHECTRKTDPLSQGANQPSTDERYSSAFLPAGTG